MSIAALLRELNEAAARNSADDVKFRYDGSLKSWVQSAVSVVALFSFAYSLAPFGLLASGLVLMTFSWICAEVVSRPYRLALPSIPVLASFMTGCLLAGTAITSQLLATMDDTPVALVALTPGVDSSQILRGAGRAALLAAATLIFYARFRVPLAVPFIILAAFIAMASVIIVFMQEFAGQAAEITQVAFVISTLVLAAKYDLSDPLRSSRRSDVAFWLYALTGLWTVFALQSNPYVGSATPGIGLYLSMITLFSALLAIGLCFDRQILPASFIFSSSAYMTLFHYRLDQSSPTVMLWPVLALLLMLVLARIWPRLRATFLRNAPLGSFVNRLPPTRGVWNDRSPSC